MMRTRDRRAWVKDARACAHQGLHRGYGYDDILDCSFGDFGGKQTAVLVISMNHCNFAYMYITVYNSKVIERDNAGGILGMTIPGLASFITPSQKPYIL